jgi:predicted HicB family RNase H-like nuclease
MTIAYNYNVVVRRVVVENEAMFEARVKEFPDLTEYADTPQEAYELAIDAINTVVEVFAEKGRPPPAAIEPSIDFSGRVTLRLPKALHRALADAADADDVSLNQHLVNVLSYFTGFAHAERAAATHWTPAKGRRAGMR